MKIHLSCAALAALLVSNALPATAAKPNESIARIDQLVLEDLQAHKLKPNPIASDEVFVRRLYLDLIGRIPTKREALAFIESKETGKRDALVDSLIGSDGYVSHHYNYFANLLRSRTNLSGNGQSVPIGLAYEQWLKRAIRENKPYNKLVYELVTASGSTWENPAIGYYIRDYGMPLDNLAITTQVFLGTQIVCAQCHNHPFDAVTQMDYYHLAAFTNGQVGTNSHPIQQKALELLKEKKGKGRNPEVEKDLRKAASEIFFPIRYNTVTQTGRSLHLPHDYKYDDAKPLSVVEPSTIMGKEAVLSESTAPVFAFGEWLTSPENPRFTKVIANRLWKRAFGVGLIEPVDDIKETTVASNAALMDYLEKLMVSLNYDLQAFQRILYRSDAYQREASPEEPVPGTPYYFAGPILRRMSAEQIWDSLVTMTVAEPDAPDSSRELLAAKRSAAVQLIAESVCDQKPAQFLKNMQEVVKFQEELSVKIEAAQAKIAKARESDDPDLVKEATKDAKLIRDELADRIEETVYRGGLASKLAPKAATPAGKGKAEVAKPGISKEVASNAKDDTLMNELAAALLAENRSFNEGMAEIVGTKSGEGIIDELVNAMFAEKEADLLRRQKQQQAREQAAWKVVSPDDKTDYRSFNKTTRDRMKRASEINSPAPTGHFLREFGQSDRELVENSSDQAAVTQSLAMLNGPSLNAITAKYSVLARDMRGEKFEDRLDTIYLTMLSRLPTAAEKAIYQEAWAADPESGSVTGIVWTLLNTRQFLFIQ